MGAFFAWGSAWPAPCAVACTAVLGLIAAPPLALAAEGAGFQPTPISATPNRDEGLAAFARMERVLLHPRCLNCHVPGAPLQGDLSRVHYPAVQRGTDGKGVAPLQCATCHSTRNSPLPHAPPGLETDGKPGWHMPPDHMKMSWLGLSGPALCKVFREPATNGHRSLAMLEQHLLTDHLVAWGWQPGPARALPPLAKPEFDEQVRAWIRNGAPCDATEPLRKTVGTTRAEAERGVVDQLRALARGGDQRLQDPARPAALPATASADPHDNASGRAPGAALTRSQP